MKTLTEEQALDLVGQLPLKRRVWISRQLWLEWRRAKAEQFRVVAAARDLGWDSMREGEQDDLIDTILHEPDE